MLRAYSSLSHLTFTGYLLPTRHLPRGRGVICEHHQSPLSPWRLHPGTATVPRNQVWETESEAREGAAAPRGRAPHPALDAEMSQPWGALWPGSGRGCQGFPHVARRMTRQVRVSWGKLHGTCSKHRNSDGLPGRCGGVKGRRKTEQTSGKFHGGLSTLGTPHPSFGGFVSSAVIYLILITVQKANA